VRRPLAAWLALRPGTPALETPPLRSGRAFIGSIGVNTHLSYAGTTYARFAVIRQRLRELGVLNVRDGLFLARPFELARIEQLAADGIRTTLILQGPPPAVASVVKGLRGALAAVESPNEPDVSLGPGWQPLLRRFLPAMRAQLAARPALRVPLLGPSVVHDSSREALRDLAPQWDVTNIHAYAGGRPPEEALDDDAETARRIEGGKPVEATETGYHNALNATAGQPPVSGRAAAVYVPRAVLEGFRDGLVRTFLYELADEHAEPALSDPEQHFGLLRADLSPKPAFVALQRLIAAVRGPSGPRARDVPGVRTDARGLGVRAVLLGRDDGSRVLALWRPAVAWSAAERAPVEATPVDVRVVFARAPRAVALAHPSESATTRALSPTTSLSLPVAADVALLSFR